MGDDVPKIVLGQVSSDHVAISVVGRMHDATDYWDGKWLVTPIAIVVGRFHAELPAIPGYRIALVDLTLYVPFTRARSTNERWWS